MNVLIINAFLYIATAYWFYKKKGFCVFTFLWCYYSLFAICAIPLVRSGIYDDFFNVHFMNMKISLIPYLLNYLCMFVVSLPLIKVKDGFSLDIINKIPKIRNYVNLFVILSVFLSILQFLISLKYGSLNGAERKELAAGLGEGYGFRDIHPLIGLIGPYIDMFYLACQPLMFLYVIHLFVSRCSGVRIMTCFILSILPTFIEAYATGSRNNMFFLLINLFFFLVVFRFQFAKDVYRKIYVWITLFSIPLTILSNNISKERYEDTSIGSDGMIFRYFGETFPNLGALYWDQVQRHTFGARMFTDFYVKLTGDTFGKTQGLIERFDFWSFYTGVPAANFKCFFGDLYIEFDTYGAVAFAILLGLLAWFAFRRFPFSLYSAPLYYLYFCFCANMIIDIPYQYTNMRYVKIVILMIIIGLYLKRKFNTVGSNE